MDLKERLDTVHQRMCAGSRTASRDLFLAALDPLEGFLARKFPSLSPEDRHDLATDAILIYSAEPAKCDTDKSSLWSYLCRIVNADAIDLLRTRTNRGALLAKNVRTDVEFWASRSKDVFRGEDAIDARHIMKLYGNKLATNDIEVRVLSLILNDEKKTSAFAKALGLDPDAPDIEKIVKQTKDRILLRMRRLRDEL
ncbi:hypothetical protein HBA54_25950 [Pelagibius litoralis]|uniref:Uncharacterized protein n=1 Tax=Pelagibius litoralis TaxID=374515 RepID=A0A967F2Z1_9PROT|nr:hypothetical protein [Pelagibius litoralis]NIA72049.1 hypothetical protein [Pelagibius litoralis]